MTKVVVTDAETAGVDRLDIDTFGTTQTVDASSLASTSDGNSVVAPEAIGGHRDMYVQLTTPQGEINLESNAFNQHLLEYNSSATGSGTRLVTWDGVNNTPNTVNATGLNHLDLTDGGLATGISIDIGADHSGGNVTFRVYKDANDWSTATVPMPNTGGAAQEALFLPFSSFTTGAGTGAGSFSDVGAVQLDISGNTAVNGQVGEIGVMGPTQLVTNLGFYQPATIGDLAFWDMNKSGIQSSSDPGAGNVTCNYCKAARSSTPRPPTRKATTSATCAGTYSLKFIPQNGTIFTLQDQGRNNALDSDPNASGVTPTFTVASGETDLTHDAGLLPIDCR